MNKQLKYLGDKDGVPQFEECEVEEQPIQELFDYDSKVVELIREKYSLDDELSLNSKSMQMYFNNCTEEQRSKWMLEIKEFTDYREQCIAKAKGICNLQQNSYI